MIELDMPELSVSGTGRLAARPGAWLILTAHAVGPCVAFMESVRVFNPFAGRVLWLDVWEGCDPAPLMACGRQDPRLAIAYDVLMARPTALRHLFSVPVPPMAFPDLDVSPFSPTADGLMYAVRLAEPADVKIAAGEAFVRRSGTRTVHAPRPGSARVIQTSVPPHRPSPAGLPTWLQTPAPTLPGPQPPAAAPEGVPDPRSPDAEECLGVETAAFLYYRVAYVTDDPAAAPEGQP